MSDRFDHKQHTRAEQEFVPLMIRFQLKQHHWHEDYIVVFPMLDSKLEISHSHVGQFSHHPTGMICLITPVSLFIFFLSFWLFALQKKVKGTRPRTTVRDSEDILEQSSFQKYTTCWVSLALYFEFARLTHGNIIFDTLEQSSFQKYTTCWVFLALCNMLYLCICVFVFMYLRI